MRRPKRTCVLCERSYECLVFAERRSSMPVNGLFVDGTGLESDARLPVLVFRTSVALAVPLDSANH